MARGNRAGTSGPRFTDTEREGIKERVCYFDLKGWNQAEIAAELGISRPQVSVYLRQVREERKAKRLRDWEDSVDQKLLQYKQIRREAWQAYEESKRDAESETEHLIADEPQQSDETRPKSKKSDPGTREESLLRIKLIRTREGRLPANQYLGTILQTLEAERALLGLDEQPPGGSTEVNVNINVLQLLQAADAQMGMAPDVPIAPSVAAVAAPTNQSVKPGQTNTALTRRPVPV